MTHSRLSLLARAFACAGFLMSAPAFADTLDAKIADAFAPFKERYAVPGSWSA